MSALPADNMAALPANVLFVFRQRTDGTLSETARTTITVSLASLLLTDYQQEDATFLTGFDGTKVFHPSVIADYTTPSTTATNLAELQALATQYATDWYLWVQGRLDLVLVGYPEWVLTGLEDHAEFVHGEEALSTRLQRDPWLDHAEEIFYRSALPVGNDEWYDEPPCGTIRWVPPYLSVYNCDPTPPRWYCVRLEPCPTGSPPIPVCEPALCASCENPPAYWDVEAAGFTGDCAIFNDTWELLPTALCEWKTGDVVDGVAVTVTLTLAGGGHTLEFEGYTSEGTLISSSYTSSAAGLPECCDELVFDRDVCGCDIIDAVDNPCAACTITPTAWELTVTDGTGCYARMNGTWTLVWEGVKDTLCVWRVPTGFTDHLDIIFRLDFLHDSALLLMHEQLSPFAVLRATASGLLPDCCAEVSFDVVAGTCATAGTTPTLTLTPLCADGGGGSGDCPVTLTAVPTCCPELPDPPDPPPPACDCPPCPYGMPPLWTFTVVSASGMLADAVGDWTLAYDTACLWQGSRGDVAAVLDYDSGTERWGLTFTNGVTVQTLHNEGPFDCCDPNTMQFSGGDDHTGIGYVQERLLLSPLGACSPCPDPGGEVSTPCCSSVLLPATLFATFSAGTGTCACLNGLTVELTWNGSVWKGTYEGCGASTDTISVFCTAGVWNITRTAGSGCMWPGGTAASSTCVPFSVLSQVNLVSGCCSGTFLITVTE